MAQSRGCSLGIVGLACVAGGLLGAVAALLLAPQSGRQSRDQLRRYARRAEKSVHDLTHKTIEVVDQALDQGREFIKDKQAVMTDAVEAGRRAMYKEHERRSGDRNACS